MATSWKTVAVSAGATLAVVGIGVAYVLGQQNAAPASQAPPYVAPYPVLPREPDQTQAAVAPTRAPAPVVQGAAEPQTTQEQFTQLARHIAGLEGEELVGSLWTFETTVVTERISFAQLERNTERFNGAGVIYSGEVLEIHDQEGGAILRLAVDDNYDHVVAVFAIAPPSDSIVRGRRARVYGLLAGSYTYTSQANYEITIPKIVALAVVPTSVPRRAPRGA